MFAAVPDDSFKNDLDAKLVKLFGEIEGVRVLAKRSQQLRTDGDDFGVHCFKSVNESADDAEEAGRRLNLK
jgi:hypothetical protein